MRSATKAKNTSIKKHAQGTGGGPASSQVLTEIDQNILTLIGPTVVEGHNSTQESNVQFDWNDEPEVCNVEYLSHDEEIVKNSVQRDNQEVMQDSTPLKSLPSHNNSKKGASKEANSIFNVMLNAKSIPQKSGTKRTAAALRYSKSIEQTEKLAEISHQDGQTRKMYYEKKLELYKKKLAPKERDVIAKENIYILLEQFLKKSNLRRCILLAVKII
ncbi:PREDICTED: uncharacterized protein LOC108766247 [Trachymyrmex cornetzi]|uniref:uncharacterized protein LOC108766247 n=1 Tax=Trachymyrmex cornetzi TaxID=471704 RepID=UPI00084F6409|nr:PREDICTED: uncharacterized protein LOC108766247 [Trachymyrmex cornetzi]